MKINISVVLNYLIFNYNNFLYKDDNIFDSLYNNNKYNELLNTINSNNIKLKKVYIQYPTISLTNLYLIK